MKFSEDSEFFLKFLIDKFEGFIKKRPERLQKSVDKLFKIIFDDINIAHNYVKYIKRNGRLKTKKFNKNKLKSSDLILSSYVPEKIRTFIDNNEGHVIEYECKLNVNKVKILFIIFDDEKDIIKYDKYAELMFTWLKVAFMYSRSICSKELKIYLYLTPEKKILPKTQVDILSPINCNTAVTNGCLEKNEIIIYRKEEWFKVFIHETFHSLGLDFANYSTPEFEKGLSSIFPLKDIDITETYAEFWATIINCSFCSYNLLEKKKDFETFMIYTRFCIQFEKIFSIFQTVKILKFMGIDYKSLYEKDAISTSVRRYLYKEKTNVFAYYILKSLFLFFHIDFLTWCDNNNINLLRFNRNPKNLMELINFISYRYDSADFIDALKEMGTYMRELKIELKIDPTGKENDFLRSTRMTAVELIKN